MTITLCHSILISDRASELEAAVKTSSHIILSQGVAGATSEFRTLSHSDLPVSVNSIYESGSTHIMTPGDAVLRNTVSGLEKAGFSSGPAGKCKSLFKL
jgi:hypothetical protein